MSEVPTVEELRAFLHRQIAEVQAMGQRENEDVTDRVNDMLEKLHHIEETHAFIEQTIGGRAAAAWVPTVLAAVSDTDPEEERK